MNDKRLILYLTFLETFFEFQNGYWLFKKELMKRYKDVILEEINAQPYTCESKFERRGASAKKIIFVVSKLVRIINYQLSIINDQLSMINSNLFDILFLFCFWIWIWIVQQSFSRRKKPLETLCSN